MRTLIVLGLIVLLVPLLLGLAIWAMQERLIFLPDARPLAAPPGWQRGTYRSDDGLDLAFLLAEGAADRPVILHFHGNGGNAGDRIGLMSIFSDAGYGVVLAEYRGYGGTPGRPGEAAIGRDARRLLAWLRARFPGRKVVLWGESLGTATAVLLAENDPDIAGVVLESPFASVREIAAGAFPWLPVGMLLRHPFETLPRMAGVSAPVLVVASAADRVTPAGQARSIAGAAARAELVMLPGGAHPAVLNDASGEGVRHIAAFLAALP